MNLTPKFFYIWSIVLSCILISACSGPREIQSDDFRSSNVSADSLAAQIPMYTNSLTTLKGKARAVVSEPGNTERVRINFSSNRDKSLVTIRNSLGIEGGQLLTDGDTLLIYDKIEKFARKIAVRGADLDRINRLASLNILDMMNYIVNPENIRSVQENQHYYLLLMHSGTNVYLNKDTYLVEQVEEPVDSELPYSKILYHAYDSLKEFVLPRRITIFGSEGDSKIDLQLTSLDLNPNLDTLAIELPDDIPVYRK